MTIFINNFFFQKCKGEKNKEEKKIRFNPVDQYIGSDIKYKRQRKRSPERGFGF